MLLRKNSRVELLLLGVFFTLVTSCEDGPLGFEELGRGELVVHQVELEPDMLDWFSEQLPLGGAVTLIGGQDTLTQARILISISGLDSIAAFDSVKLMIRRYDPDVMSQSDMRFLIYPLSATWDEASCTWVLADAYTKWSKLGGEFDSTDLIAEILVEEDTVGLKLDPDLLETYSKGIILLPQDEGFCYLGADEEEDYAPFILGFKDEDTTEFSSLAGSDYYAAVEDATIIEPYEAPSQDTLIGAGFAWRVFMRFPIQTLPTQIDITSADLWFGYENAFSPVDTFDFAAYRLIDVYDGRFSELSSALAGRDSMTISEDSLSVSMAGVAQFWVDEPDSNFGLLLTHSFLSYNPAFGQEKKIYALGRIRGVPRLVITYTDIPETRFTGGDQ